MNELINIIVDVLSSTQKGESVRIDKNSDTSFSFIGSGVDGAGRPYDYKITAEFTPKQTDKEKKLEEMKYKLTEGKDEH